MKKVAIILLITGIVVSGWWLFNREFGLISPLGSSRTAIKEKSVKVLGFLPTWMVGKTRIYKDEVDDLVFLGVELSGDGSLIWDVQSKKIGSESYLNLKDSVTKNGGKNILGIKLFKDKEIDKLLASTEYRKKAAEEIKAIVEVGEFDGVNLDFEYMSDANRLLKDDFVSWLSELNNFEVGEMSVDVFANTVIKGDSEKIKKLMEKLDYLVVMGYDFHRPSSDWAGAVAPIGSNVGERNLSEVIQKVGEADIDEKKIILALPLYGYEWEVENMEPNSKVIGTGWMVSYKEGMDKYNLESKWDELAMSPWISRSEEVTRKRNKRVLVKRRWRTVVEEYKTTVYYQAYFENERSLQAKLDLAVGGGLGGVGFWALGYEGMDGRVWSIVSDKIAK